MRNATVAAQDRPLSCSSAHLRNPLTAHHVGSFGGRCVCKHFQHLLTIRHLGIAGHLGLAPVGHFRVLLISDYVRFDITHVLRFLDGIQFQPLTVFTIQTRY